MGPHTTFGRGTGTGEALSPEVALTALYHLVINMKINLQKSWTMWERRQHKRVCSKGIEGG